METPKHAEIAGAGIAGLTVATLLARHGWSVRVHERSPYIRELGSGIFLKNNCLTVLEEMGVFQYLSTRGVYLEAAEIRDEYGCLLQSRMLTERSRVFNVPRTELISVLYDAARSAGVDVLTSSTVVAVSPDGELRIEGGGILKADLVVVADGWRSRLRDGLGLTARATTLTGGATRLLIPRTAAERRPMTRESWSGTRRIGIAQCNHESTYAYLSCLESDKRGRAIPVDVDSWCRAFPHLTCFIQRMGDVPSAHHPYSYVYCRTWSRGRAVVLGDAAHAMPPTLGQGAGLAILNARALAEALHACPDVATALIHWERTYRPVTDVTQRWALRYNALTTRWPRGLFRVRSGIIWAFGHVKWLNDIVRIADRTVVASMSSGVSRG